MRRVFAGWPLGQLLAVAVIAATGIALLVAAVPRLYTAFRASRITAFACDDDSLRALEPGDWVRLTDCDTDMFHQSGLADGHGQRSHTLLPVREHETSVEAIHGMCHHDHDDKTYRGATFARSDTHWHYWPPGADSATSPPMRAPIGAHLTSWNLDHLPDG